MKYGAVILIIAAVVIVLVFGNYGKQGKVYDCGIAEWHPDVPQEVREECRKLRRQYKHETTI